MRRLVVTLAMLLVAASASAAGIDISWNDCVLGSSTTATNRNFTCLGATNQNYQLFFQFRTPVAMPHFVAITMYVDIVPIASGPLAPFWHYEGNGCNGSAVKGAQISGAIPATCAVNYLEPWGGGPDGTFAIAAYGADFQRAGLGHLIALGARGDGFPITANTNYYGAHIQFNNRNRHTCFGCTQQATVLWELARFESNDGSPAVDISNPDNGTNCVGINGAGAGTCGALPVKATTWGAIKSMYR